MREMKDSGIEWVGKVPATWKIMPNKYIMTKKKVIKEVYDGENIISLSMNGVIIRDLEAGGKMPKTFDGYQIVYPGNLLMCLFDYDVTPRCIGLIKDYGVTSPAYSQFVMNNGNYSGYYYYYYLMIDHTKALLHLAKNLRHSLTEEQLGAILAPVPTIEEQQRIVDFLDFKCSKIDASAEDIQKEISLLEEYKKSVITEAVTKGLNPDAEMKDSGIEWIGDINPKASLCRLKFFSYMKGRIGWQGLKSEDFIDNGPYCVTGTDFINGKINWDTCYHVSEERYKMDSNIQLKIGDLLVTKDGTIGKLAKVTELPEKACLNSHLLIIRPLNERFTNEYLYYVISSDVFVRYYKYSSTGSTIESLSQDKLGNFIFPVYDLLSQQQIVDYLDTKCSEIDSLIADKKRQLDILADYKKSLIYEYVTGKKEVPVNE